MNDQPPLVTGAEVKLVVGTSHAFQQDLNAALKEGWGFSPDFPWHVEIVSGVATFSIMLFRPAGD